MATFPAWSSELSVNNQLIDSEHQKLIAICTTASKYEWDGSRESFEKFHVLLNDLIVLAVQHFYDEEKFLKKNGCPTLAEHQAEHTRFINILTELLIGAFSGKIDIAGALEVSSDWLTNHVLETDLGCKKYFDTGTSKIDAIRQQIVNEQKEAVAVSFDKNNLLFIE